MISDIKSALDSAITETAAVHSDGKQFSRQRKLALDTMLRLLIGAEGGSLGKIAREAGVDVTPAALSQRRAKSPPAYSAKYSTASMPLVATMRLFAAIASSPLTAQPSICLAIPPPPALYAMKVSPTATINYT